MAEEPKPEQKNLRVYITDKPVFVTDQENKLIDPLRPAGYTLTRVDPNAPTSMGSEPTPELFKPGDRVVARPSLELGHAEIGHKPDDLPVIKKVESMPQDMYDSVIADFTKKQKDYSARATQAGAPFDSAISSMAEAIKTLETKIKDLSATREKKIEELGNPPSFDEIDEMIRSTLGYDK